MSHAAEVAAVLEADTGGGGVDTLLTGGIYTWIETGRNGITRTSTPDVYVDADNLPDIQPCAVVKDRAMRPDGQIIDEVDQDASYTQIVEIWLYNDSSADFSTLETVANRIYQLLQFQQVGDGWYQWVNQVMDERGIALENAVMLRADYQVFAVRS